MSKLFRVKESHILDVRVISNYYVEKAFKLGYVFVRDRKDDVYMIGTTKTKKAFKIDLIENIEIVKEENIC